MIPAKHHRFIFGLLLLGSFGISAMYAASWAGIRINTSPSAARGLWMTTRDHVPPVAGTSVTVCLPGEWAEFAVARGYINSFGECNGRESLIKQVIAIPGDTVAIDGEGMVVNGARIPNTKALNADDAGRSLQGVDHGTYEVRPGQVWVVGPSQSRSFDSRYYGPLPIECIVRTARPWLTF